MSNPEQRSAIDRAWEHLIGFFVDNKLVVLVLTLLLIGAGISFAPFRGEFAGIQRNPVPVDALPDISENQQIVFTKWAGRSPRGPRVLFSRP